MLFHNEEFVICVILPNVVLQDEIDLAYNMRVRGQKFREEILVGKFEGKGCIWKRRSEC